VKDSLARITSKRTKPEELNMVKAVTGTVLLLFASLNLSISAAQQPPPNQPNPSRPPAGVPQTPEPPVTTFFVADTPTGTGNLGGLAGADQICQNAAQTLGGPAATKTWHAYLSQEQRGTTPRVNARGRIGPGPWYNVRGQLIASNVADLHGDQVRDRNNIQAATALDIKGEQIPGNVHDALTGSDSQGRAFTDGYDHTCNNWTSDGMTLPVAANANPAVPADRARAMLGHTNRQGGGNTSWNAAHMSQGCSKQALINTGGAGKLYCFATN
jgi:hypothetical protein